MSFLRQPFRYVPFFLHAEVYAHLHYLLAFQHKGICISRCVDLCESFLSRFVKLEFHYINVGLRFKYNVNPPLCRALLHLYVIVGEQSEYQI